MSQQVYQRVALIGLGLIASSMFWAIKRGGLVGEVTGYARSAETRETARRTGLCDRVCRYAGRFGIADEHGSGEWCDRRSDGRLARTLWYHAGR